MEHWSQIRIETERAPDEALLTERVAPLLARLQKRLVAWHFFWEPDLWIRLRWRSEQHRDDGLREAREAAELEGRVWRIEDYDWRADREMMTPELWPLCQKEWMQGSELALRHAAAEGVKSRDFYWARHTHLFTNQLAATWAEEARLCVRQARYRVYLLSRARGHEADRPALEATLAKLDAALAELPRVATVEARFLDAWRADGRPSLVERLDLPPGFSEARAMDGVVGD